MATIDKKQTRWYAKSTFDSLDKTTIPVGTEIQVTGPIEETDLTADLQTKINGKLTAPTTPTADSVVTMAADGTTGTKPLSEFGGKLYKHKIQLEASSILSYLNFYVYNRSNTKLTLNDIAGEYFLAAVTGGMRSGVLSCIIEPSTLNLKTEGVVLNSENEVFVLNSVTDPAEIRTYDTVTEV